MKTIILILLIFTIPLFSQVRSSPLFNATDTIFTATSDTVDVRYWAGGVAEGPWVALDSVFTANDTTYVTLDDKAGERAKIYPLDQQDDWGWYEMAQFRIRAEDDTINSGVITMNGVERASLLLQPVLIGDSTVDTLYYKAVIGGK